MRRGSPRPPVLSLFHQAPAAHAVICAVIFAAFVVPLSQAESQQRLTAKSLDREEEHLPGPMTTRQTNRRFAAILPFRAFVLS